MAARPSGPYIELRVLQSWVGQARGPPHRFRMNRLPFTQGSFYMLARLVLGKLLVNRSDAIHRFPPVFGEFGRTWYGKRACPCCFLEHGIFVLDSEWHWVFDCLHFDEVSLKLPVFESHYQ